MDAAELVEVDYDPLRVVVTWRGPGARPEPQSRSTVRTRCRSPRRRRCRTCSRRRRRRPRPDGEPGSPSCRWRGRDRRRPVRDEAHELVHCHPAAARRPRPAAREGTSGLERRAGPVQAPHVGGGFGAKAGLSLPSTRS
ncbi:hypothetical protein HBB16_09780 [Pseudonocardia sp. MCCB 268]|nr:hypothetical protein [Pseudonocardia cytotoxica]